MIHQYKITKSVTKLISYLISWTLHFTPLPHCGRMSLCGVHDLGHHWFKQWYATWTAPGHYINQWWLIVIWAMHQSEYINFRAGNAIWKFWQLVQDPIHIMMQQTVITKFLPSLPVLCAKSFHHIWHRQDQFYNSYSQAVVDHKSTLACMEYWQNSTDKYKLRTLHEALLN